jgi:alpha-galactosidase
LRATTQALVAVVVFIFFLPTIHAQTGNISEGLALTPPMGWNSWNKFGCDVREELIRQTADAMVKSGMKDAGYQFVVIDDCWQVSRDKEGNIVADPQRFPSGIKALADYVHSLGLKFGIYSDAGSKTCAGRPASLGHEYQDARQYAAWGVDYLKYDWCNTGTQDARAAYALIREALNASGRPIVLSICEWGTAKPWLWGKEVGGNLWRTTGDITDQWDGKKDGSLGMLTILDLQVGLDSFAGPLIAGNDLRNMRPEIREILTNKDVVAIDQDPLGREGKRVRKDGDVEVWAKELKDGSRAVVLLNRGSAEKQIAVKWEELGYPGHLSALVRDLWQHKNLGKFTDQLSSPVAAHGVVMVTVRP